MSADARPAAGAVLAGGASRRFGSDKTVARLGPVTLVERVAEALRQGGVTPVVAVGAPRHGYPVTSVSDDHPGAGPLGGVLTALRWSPQERTVVVAADLPLLDPDTVRALVARAGTSPGAVAVARAGGRLQPTCACWPSEVRGAAEAAFAEGERSIIGLLGRLWVEPVDVPEWVLADVDTPGELARLAEAWSR